jgi:hypothetical protein
MDDRLNFVLPPLARLLIWEILRATYGYGTRVPVEQPSAASIVDIDCIEHVSAVRALGNGGCLLGGNDDRSAAASDFADFSLILKNRDSLLTAVPTPTGSSPSIVPLQQS